MRMARVNITVPDELLAQARAAHLNVSRLATAALADELDRMARTTALDAYLAELDAELGPVPEQELAEARAWIGDSLGQRGQSTAAAADAGRRSESA